MTVTINTTRGTFIVPADKHEQLINWLTNNAIKVMNDNQQIREIQQPFCYSQPTVLLNETI